MASAVVAS
jgi:adenylyl- and sulfurtransferase ThiI